MYWWHEKRVFTDGVKRGAWRVALATTAWSAAHTLLASHRTKAAARRVLGDRARNGLYRATYNCVALTTFALLVAHLRRQPHKVLYHVRGPAAAVMQVGQFASLAYCLGGAWQTGVGNLSGLPNLFAWLTGKPSIPPEPPGQTPPPHRTPTPRGSPAALSRQAVNFFLVPLLWLTPRMTTRLAAYNAVSTTYLYLGSLHAERALRRTFGDAYDETYRDRGVAFFVPGMRSGKACR